MHEMCVLTIVPCASFDWISSLSHIEGGKSFSYESPKGTELAYVMGVHLESLAPSVSGEEHKNPHITKNVT